MTAKGDKVYPMLVNLWLKLTNDYEIDNNSAKRRDRKTDIFFVNDDIT